MTGEYSKRNDLQQVCSLRVGSRLESGCELRLKTRNDATEAVALGSWNTIKREQPNKGQYGKLQY